MISTQILNKIADFLLEAGVDLAKLHPDQADAYIARLYPLFRMARNG